MKRTIKIIGFVYVAFLFSNNCFPAHSNQISPQEQRIDSLKILLPDASDSTKSNIYFKLYKIYLIVQIDSANTYAKKQLECALPVVNFPILQRGSCHK